MPDTVQIMRGLRGRSGVEREHRCFGCCRRCRLLHFGFMTPMTVKDFRHLRRMLLAQRPATGKKLDFVFRTKDAPHGRAADPRPSKEAAADRG